MDSSTGRLYPSHAVALAELTALGRPADAVEVTGTPEAVQRVSAAVRAAHKAKRKAQKKSRRANRGGKS